MKRTKYNVDTTTEIYFDNDTSSRGDDENNGKCFNEFIPVKLTSEFMIMVFNRRTLRMML